MLYLKAGMVEGEFQNRVIYPSGRDIPDRFNRDLFRKSVMAVSAGIRGNWSIFSAPKASPAAETDSGVTRYGGNRSP
jgi:hypothetical protein